MNRSLPLLVLLTAAAARGGVAVDDPFADGIRTNFDSGDLAGLVWYANAGTTLAVSNDAVLGPALRLTPTASFGKGLGFFGPVSLAESGDYVRLTFDFRFASTPGTNSAGFRVGLFDSKGTRQSADGDSTNRYDDPGYGILINPGVDGTDTWVFAEAAGNDILGGGAPYYCAPFGDPGASTNGGTAGHTARLEIVRLGDGSLALSAQVDGLAAAGGTLAPASVLTYGLDMVAFGIGSAVVPFVLDNVRVEASREDGDALRARWVAMTAGDTNLDLGDATVQSRIAGITTTAQSRWDSLIKSLDRTNLWSDVTNLTDSADLTTAYSRLSDMALAYATPGSALEGDAALLADTVGALDWMYTNRYNETKTEYSNWWDWEIGVPLRLTAAALLVYDALTPTQRAAYGRAIDKFTPSPSLTGANRVWKSRVVAQRALMTKHSGKLYAARDGFSPVFPYVTSSDGFYRDGSFIQHGRHPYTGGYGNALISDFSFILPWLDGSVWAIVNPQRTNVVQWVYDSYEPVIYRGAMACNLRGREIAREGGADHDSGHGSLTSILRLSLTAPSADAVRMRSMLKDWILSDTYRNFVSASAPLPLIGPAKQLLADTNAVRRPEPVFHRQYPQMDRVVHCRPGFAVMLSLFSTRVYNYESINTENLRGWFTGDGMTYLYNDDLAQFSDPYWPAINSARLPGTTIDTTARGSGWRQSNLSSNAWVGGAALGEFGAVGMDLDALDSTLAARKSWFCFDDEVVCLGANITGSAARVETTIENRRLQGAATNAFTVDGAVQPAALGWSNAFAGASWCHLDGAAGYWFPSPAAVQAVREARTSTWYSINNKTGSTNLVSASFLTLWMSHGVAPTNGRYAYVLLPNKSAAQTAAYAANPPIAILTNGAAVQAVTETNLGLLAANFWTKGVASAGPLTCSGQASVVTRETGDVLTVALSDPTQTNTAPVVLTLARSAVSLLAADPAITVLQLQPEIRLSANVSGTKGRTMSASFATDAGPQVALTGPPDGAVLPYPASVSLTAWASPSGSVAAVSCCAGEIVLGSSPTSPCPVTLEGLYPGNYAFHAVAVDTSGVARTSAFLHVTVTNLPLTRVPANAAWRFYDSTNSPGAGWRDPNFDDASWSGGVARLGYGGDGEVTQVASNRQRITTYFRHAFVAPPEPVATSLVIRLQRDDGAVVYLNGAEILRSNMPTGTIASGTYATGTVSGAAETAWFTSTVSATALEVGTNVLAAEVHQNGTNSSDLGFALELAAAGEPPTLLVDALRTGFVWWVTWPAGALDAVAWGTTNLPDAESWQPLPGVPVFDAGRLRVPCPTTNDAQVSAFRIQR